MKRITNQFLEKLEKIFDLKFFWDLEKFSKFFEIFDFFLKICNFIFVRALGFRLR